MTDTEAPAEAIAIADFRSDTVTRPTAAMRTAMAEAAVGDDVFGDDPTVRALEEEVAALFRREAALFVTSGSQGNQIAAHLHTDPGQEVALSENSHSYDWELAGLAVLSGLQARTLPTERGLIDVDAVKATLRDAGGFRPACKLLIVENTHNFHGGSVVPLAHMRKLHDAARERGAAVHLDGARIWNAAAATDTPVDDYGRLADTISVCFSKGLGAPAGSALVGDRAFIDRARETRKLFGGGLRQVGVLAAPALVGLHQQRPKLGEDHRRAKELKAGMCQYPNVTSVYGDVDTNIVFIQAEGHDAAKMVEAMKADGVLTFATGPDTLRFVTHYDVDDDDVQRAIASFGTALVKG